MFSYCMCKIACDAVNVPSCDNRLLKSIAITFSIFIVSGHKNITEKWIFCLSCKRCYVGEMRSARSSISNRLLISAKS